MTTDLHDRRTPKERFRRSVWATFFCWLAIVFVAYGLPALGYGDEDNRTPHYVAQLGVIWVPVTIWFLKRKMRREIRAEEGGPDD